MPKRKAGGKGASSKEAKMVGLVTKVGANEEGVVLADKDFHMLIPWDYLVDVMNACMQALNDKRLENSGPTDEQLLE